MLLLDVPHGSEVGIKIGNPYKLWAIFGVLDTPIVITPAYLVIRHTIMYNC